MTRIVATRVHRYRLPLRSSWRTAGGDCSSREGWVLRVDTDEGCSGYGDCAPLPASGTETAAAAQAALCRHAQRLMGRSAGEALAHLARASDDAAPAARCAVETALLDLLGQASASSLADLLGASPETEPLPTSRDRSSVLVNAALGSLCHVSDDALLAALGAGFRVCKLKVGLLAVSQEVARLRQIAVLLPTGVSLRFDANRAWSVDDAAIFVRACSEFPVEMVEEPLARPHLAALQRLQATTALAIAVDESAASLDVAQLLATRAIRRLVVKPARCGGVLPALALARQAADAGVECVVTSAMDSACGVRAAAHLAAALDNGLAHGLATSGWLADDTGLPPTIDNGRLSIGKTSGLGFSPHPPLDFVDLCPP